MRKILIKSFIKDYKNYSNPDVRSAYGKISGIIGIITNIILCIIKIIAGVIIGSMAILADGINNLSDAGTSIITYVGFKLSNVPADKDHPFGHQRIEYITGLIVSFIIVSIGLILMYSSFLKVLNPEEVDYEWYAILILAIAILVKIWQSAFYRQNGKAINSKALIANSVDSLNDVVATSAVLISTIIAMLTTLNLDAYMGILVSIFIIFSGIRLIKETISPLLGEAPSKEYTEKITNKLLSYSGVLGIHDLVIHTYGPAKTFMTVHVEVDSSVNIKVSHNIIDNIEFDFKKLYNVDLVIHMDPIDINCEETNEMHRVLGYILTDIDPILQYHDLRIVTSQTNKKLIFDLVIPLKYDLTEEEIKRVLKEKIKVVYPGIQLVLTIDRQAID